MRFAFLVPAPFDSITGGTEYDRRIIAGLRALGHDVAVQACDDQQPHAARTIWSQLDADASVVIDNIVLPSFVGMETEFARRDVTLLHHHPLGLETGLMPAQAETLLAVERNLSHAARRIIATSPITARLLADRFGIATDRISVITPGTTPVLRSAGSSDGIVRVLSVGALIPRKGYDVLLRALARLFDLNWQLTIAGSPDADPATAAALHALPASLSIEARVRFAGEVTGAPLEQLWHQADLFALATHYGGFGMAIAEALAHGLPVAVCQGGAATALLTPEFGAACPVGDVDQLSKTLRRLIFDTALRHSMSEAAWSFGQTLPDWPQQAQTFAAVFTSKKEPTS